MLFQASGLCSPGGELGQGQHQEPDGLREQRGHVGAVEQHKRKSHPLPSPQPVLTFVLQVSQAVEGTG